MEELKILVDVALGDTVWWWTWQCCVNGWTRPSSRSFQPSQFLWLCSAWQCECNRLTLPGSRAQSLYFGLMWSYLVCSTAGNCQLVRVASRSTKTLCVRKLGEGCGTGAAGDGAAHCSGQHAGVLSSRTCTLFGWKNGKGQRHNWPEAFAVPLVGVSSARCWPWPSPCRVVFWIVG